MSFLDWPNMQLDQRYKLTEFVENMQVSSGVYYLISIIDTKKGQKVLGFFKTLGVEPEVYLALARAQFGDRTWRHAFKGRVIPGRSTTRLVECGTGLVWKSNPSFKMKQHTRTSLGCALFLFCLIDFMYMKSISTKILRS